MIERITGPYTLELCHELCKALTLNLVAHWEQLKKTLEPTAEEPGVSKGMRFRLNVGRASFIFDFSALNLSELACLFRSGLHFRPVNRGPGPF